MPQPVQLAPVRRAAARRPVDRGPRERSRPEQVTEVGAERVDPLLRRHRARARSSRRARRPRTPRRSGRGARRRRPQPRRRGQGRPTPARELRDRAPSASYDITLHLGAERSAVEAMPAVVEPLRVAGVLPRLIGESARRSPLVLDEPVAVTIAVLVDRGRSAARAPTRAAPRRAQRRRPPPDLGEQHEEQRRGVDRAVIDRSNQLVAALPRLPRGRPRRARRPGTPDRPRSACSAASARSAPIASSGPKTQRLQRRDQRVAPEHGHEPRGIPAAGSFHVPPPSPVCICNAARSFTDCPKACSSSSQDVCTRGTCTCQASSDARTRVRSSPKCRLTPRGARAPSRRGPR